MEFLRHFFDLLRHFNLDQLLLEYGSLLYAVFFVIIFVETGVVILPFLPGDSLLFVAGALAARPGGLSLGILIPLLVLAAFLGDNLNYFIGDRLGPRVFREDFRFLKRKYLLQTQEFYARHGGKTLILARFVPIVRTFAPFVAGLGTMTYRRFVSFCIVGAVLWVVSMSVAGYLFGAIPFVQKNFELVVIGVVVLSLLPVAWQALRRKSMSNEQ